MHIKDLTPETLVSAYCSGHFPMPETDGEVFWYRPDPRAVIPLDQFHVSQSLKRHMKKYSDDEITISQDFENVMRACGDREETWIQEEVIQLYTHMHDLGLAHSIEVKRNGRLIGGTYGLQINSAFFAESMFHYETNASKVALYHLVDFLNTNGFQLLECQFLTPHLASLGAIEIDDTSYTEILKKALEKQPIWVS